MPSNILLFQKLREAELKTAELYRVMADKVDSTATREKLRELAEDELLHAKMVENTKQLWLKAKLPDEKMEKIFSKVESFLEELEKQLRETEDKDHLTTKECAEIAQKLEVNMGEIHLNSLKNLKDSQLRSVVEKLSTFDRKHLERINKWD